MIATAFMLTSACGSSGSDLPEYSYLDIVKDGVSEYRIVIAQDASECERFSAEELQSFLSDSTGASLPILRDDAVRFNPRAKMISVGQTKLFDEAGLELGIEYGSDGFFIGTRGNTIFLCGTRDRGTLYSVYDFLEDYVGVRFLTADYTHLPRKSDVSIPEGDRKEVPDIPLRCYWSPRIQDDALFSARMRMVSMYAEEKAEYGYGLTKDFVGGSHNLEYLVPFSEYGEEHPEFFWTYWMGHDICLSVGLDEQGNQENPDAISPVTIAAESLKQQIRDNPEARFFAICQMDSPTGCPCETCSARSTLALGGRSGILVRFVNAVNRIIQEWIPTEYESGREVSLVTFAYEYTKYAPLDAKGKPAVVPDEEVVIWMAPSDANYAFSFRDERQSEVHMTMIDGWRKTTDNFFFWDYNLNYMEYLFYFPGVSTFQDNYSFYRDIGAKYVFSQAGARTTDPENWNTDLKTYLASKLMWDADLDAQSLIDEFNALYYGEYAEEVSEVIRLFEENFAAQAADPEKHLYIMINGAGVTMDATLYPCTVLERATELIEGALNDLKNSDRTDAEKATLQKHLLKVLVMPQRMLLRNYDNYYLGDALGKIKLGRSFVKNCELLGLDYLGDAAPSVNELKEQFGEEK